MGTLLAGLLEGLGCQIQFGLHFRYNRDLDSIQSHGGAQSEVDFMGTEYTSV